MVQRVSQEVQENRNDMQLLLDQQQHHNNNNNIGPSSSARIGQCFVCRTVNSHPQGNHNCPEALALVDQGYCRWDKGCLVLPNGEEIPRTGSYETLAMFIHQMHKGQPQALKGNCPPGQTSQIAYVEVVEPEEANYTDYDSEMPETNLALW